MQSEQIGKKVSSKVPILDLNEDIQKYWDEYRAAFERVLRSGQFILGPEGAALEREMANLFGARFAVAVNSGTDALVIGLRSLGIKSGDEVITSPFTFFATAEAISAIGATPVFADIDPVTLNLSCDEVAAKVTSKTKAVIPVHLFGLTADLDPLLDLAQERGLWVLEDVAQATGGRYKKQYLGTLGDAGAFSFFPSKNLGAFGDGGMLITSDPKVAEIAQKLRTHGSIKRYANETIGYNSRLNEVQAAILRTKLPRLAQMNSGRRAAADRYNEILGRIDGIQCPVVPEYAEHTFHQYTIRILGGRRDHVAHNLAEHGVSTMVYYPTPVHRLAVYRDLGISMPAAELAAQEVLSLPIWPGISNETQLRIADLIRQALRG